MAIVAYAVPDLLFEAADNNGSPLAGGLLYSYAAGTNNPIATYQDSQASVTNPNPVVLNFRGEAPVFLKFNVGYKLLLTDSLGNTIPGYPVDNVFNPTLTTLYGGTDTGNANVYVLNYLANFTSLVDGVIIYWKPSHNSTGPSTLSVNGLGAVPIVQQNGNAVGFGTIAANTIVQVMYLGGSFVLLSASTTIPQTGSFGYTTTGFTTVFNGIATYSVTNGVCTLSIPHTTDYSTPLVNNANFFTLVGLPSILQPISIQQTSPFNGADGGVLINTVYALLNPGSNVITLVPTAAGTANSWNNVGTKAIGGVTLYGSVLGINISYSLVT
jgi:hypothetical protein